MTVYVATCDKYDHLIPGFAHQFNKYWGADQAVVVLGFRTPARPLPANFSFHSMEPVETRPWSTNLAMFFDTVQDPWFTFLLDDYWLRRPVDRADVARMEREVIAGAVKGDLSENTKNFAHTPLADGLVLAAPQAQYRTSTQPCIWTRKFMLTLLVPGLNPWQFELQNNAAVKHGRIVGPAHQIYDYANIYYKGHPAQYMIDTLTADDRAALKAEDMMDWLT